MVHFTQSGSCSLFYSAVQVHAICMRVTPFGSPGIVGCLLLPPAFRSLPRPSSPSGSQASTINLYSLDHIIFSSCAGFLPLLQARPARYGTPRSPRRIFQPSSGYLRSSSQDSLHILPFLPSLITFKELRTNPLLSFLVHLEIRGFEPLTLGLQSRCSSQLSYIPGFYRQTPSLHKKYKKGEEKKQSQARSVHHSVFLSLRKEVIQPHLPVRLPCYDFTPLAGLAFGSGPPCGLACRLRAHPTRMV